MTSLIVTGLGELAPGDKTYGAMVGTACILFLFVAIINLTVQAFTGKKKDKPAKKARAGKRREVQNFFREKYRHYGTPVSKKR